MAELGAVYEGKVVNITKFGAFVNVLPGKDGLLHISKLGRGKRIDRVEDVLNLGDEVSVRVDDIDNAGKLSLSLVGDDDGPAPEGSSGERAPAREPVSVGAGERSSGGAGGADSGREVVSFEDTWEDTAKSEFGDLGPDDGGSAERSGGGGGAGGGSRRGGRRGGGRR